MAGMGGQYHRNIHKPNEENRGRTPSKPTPSKPTPSKPTKK
jgi:hypothetical protein